VRWETERPFDGQLCHEYAYPKLLKLDNSSSSYGPKNWCVFMPHSVGYSMQGLNLSVLRLIVSQKF